MCNYRPHVNHVNSKSRLLEFIIFLLEGNGSYNCLEFPGQTGSYRVTLGVRWLGPCESPVAVQNTIHLRYFLVILGSCSQLPAVRPLGWASGRLMRRRSEHLWASWAAETEKAEDGRTGESLVNQCTNRSTIRLRTAKVTPRCPTNVSPPVVLQQRRSHHKVITFLSLPLELRFSGATESNVFQLISIVCIPLYTNTIEIAYIHGSSKLQNQHRHHVIVAQTKCVEEQCDSCT